ncbi:MAG: hypothetical protein HRT89_02760 [Lentisphaeria bacterium]|nr:hypothetical protein [Lentisphaeria bacterium]NQZ66970.1 hypothetical protein [Lentisphaeria bacterium]
MKIHIIYLEDEMLLSKANYKDWREIQTKFEAYKASLGPWGEDEIIEYLKEDYSELYIENKEKIMNYFKSKEVELNL